MSGFRFILVYDKTNCENKLPIVMVEWEKD